MQSLRAAHRLTRLVLVWFALSLGVAMASPLVNPQAIELICSGSGAMKLVVKTSDGTASVQQGSHTLDCALCAAASAPPPPEQAAPLLAPVSWAYVSWPAAPAPMAVRTAAPLPARGPPTL
jgi:hypothetical protein